MRSNFKSLWRRERIFYLELNSRGKGGLGKKKRSFGLVFTIYPLYVYRNEELKSYSAFKWASKVSLQSDYDEVWTKCLWMFWKKKFLQKYFGNIRFGPNHSLRNFKKLKKSFFSLAAWCVHHKDFLPWVLIGSARKVVL